MNIIERSKSLGFKVIKHLNLDRFMILQLLASQVDKNITEYGKTFGVNICFLLFFFRCLSAMWQWDERRCNSGTHVCQWIW